MSECWNSIMTKTYTHLVPSCLFLFFSFLSFTQMTVFLDIYIFLFSSRFVFITLFSPLPVSFLSHLYFTSVSVLRRIHSGYDLFILLMPYLRHFLSLNFALLLSPPTFSYFLFIFYHLLRVFTLQYLLFPSHIPHFLPPFYSSLLYPSLIYPRFLHSLHC